MGMEHKFKIPNCLKNPLFLSALVCALLFYSGLVRCGEKRRMRSLLPTGSVVSMEGAVSSTPVRTGFRGGCYRADFCVERAYSESASSSAAGVAVLFIPCEIVESLFPGKIGTAAGDSCGALVEDGSRLRVSVSERVGGGFFVSAVEPLPGGRGLLASMLRFRAVCRLSFRHLMHSWGEAGGFLLALLSGSRDCTDAAVSDAFRKAGLSHVIALSGMHVSLFGGLAAFLGRKLATRRFADALSLSAVAFFVWFAGLSPSLFRALVCSLVMSLSSFLRLKRPEPLSALSLCFLVHACVFPSHLSEAAFMLSYSSLCGIILFDRLFSRLLSCRLLPPLSASLSSSVSAIVSTAPVTVSLFGTFTPVGALSTAVVSPLVTLFIYTGLSGIAVCLAAPFLSVPFGAIISFIYGLVKKTALFFAGFPAFSIF